MRRKIMSVWHRARAFAALAALAAALTPIALAGTADGTDTDPAPCSSRPAGKAAEAEIRTSWDPIGYQPPDKAAEGKGAGGTQLTENRLLEETPSPIFNGITAGPIRVFDEYALAAMLDRVRASLAQTQYPNATELYGKVGSIQASSITRSVSELSVLGPSFVGATQQAVPSTSTGEAVTTTTNAGETDNTTTSTDVGSTSSSPAATPATAAAPSATPAAPELSLSEALKTHSISPQELLRQQTALTYDLINLQMLLDGALSDRYLADQRGANPRSRARAVIGFEISIDPQYKHKLAVAEVDIVVRDEREPRDRPGLQLTDQPEVLMLLPREKTYNVARLSSSTRSLGLGTLVGSFSVGYGGSKSAERFYIGQDTDTVALVRWPGLSWTPKGPPVRHSTLGAAFAWQFRPVFDRSVVDPGTRQVFALLSLPATASDESWLGMVYIRTRWRRYDRLSGTASQVLPGTTNITKLDSALVIPITNLEDALAPRVTDAQWQDAGGGRISAIIDGYNFSRGTCVTIGDTVLTPDSGFNIIGENRLRFVADGTLVARSRPIIVGRHGKADLGSRTSRAEGCGASSYTDPYERLECRPETAAYDGENTLLTLELTARDSAAAERLVTDRRPIVILGNRVYGAGTRRYESVTHPNDTKNVTIKLLVPDALLVTAGALTVRDLVGSGVWQGGDLKVPPKGFSATLARVVTTRSDCEDAQDAQIAIQGTDLEGAEVLFAGTSIRSRYAGCVRAWDPSLISFMVRNSVVERMELVIVRKGDRSVVLPLLKGTQALRPPRITGCTPDTVKLKSGVTTIVLRGENFDSIKAVNYGYTRLDAEVASHGQVMRVELVPEVTADPGPRDIKFILSDDSKQWYTLTVK
jgi:hypothetical protein